MLARLWSLPSRLWSWLQETLTRQFWRISEPVWRPGGASSASPAREVAQAAEIRPVYLRVLETGLNPKTGRASRPSAEVLVRLARELDLGADDLLLRAGYSELRAEQVGAIVDDEGPAGPGPDLAPELRRIADAIELARTRPSDFMRLVIVEDLARFEAHVAAVAAGSLLCGPADEPRVRKLALVDACQRSLQALSFEDDAWWLGPQADGYIDSTRERRRLARRSR